jgi:Xaa-Pro aminopeptidase
MIKSPAEIALLKRSNDVTIAAYRAALTTLADGLAQNELAHTISAAFDALGYPGEASVQFGKWTALPHGSATPQKLKSGDIVMIDGGTTVEGYQSDITRTTVFGTPTARQRDVWQIEQRAQAAAFAGDDARRAVRIGGRRRAQGHRGRRLRPRIQDTRTAAPHRARHRPRVPRMDELRQR